MDVFTPEQRSFVMSSVPNRDTTPEKLVRAMARRVGLRFRANDTSLPGSPDLVIRKHRTVVFVHGCFWHGHSCRRGTRPASNKEYWARKLDRNKRRDQRVSRALRRQGWHVFTIWECQLKSPLTVAKKLERIKQHSADE